MRVLDVKIIYKLLGAMGARHSQLGALWVTAWVHKAGCLGTHEQQSPRDCITGLLSKQGLGTHS